MDHGARRGPEALGAEGEALIGPRGCRKLGRMRVWLRLAFPTVLGVSALAATARAQEADPVLQAAKADFEEGQTLYIREQWNDAAAKFLSAYDKKPFGAFLFNAAVAFEKSKKYEQAIQFFEKYMEKEPSARDSTEVKERIEGIRALLAPPSAATPRKLEVLPRIETKGLVIIDSKPAGADIYFDDKKTGAAGKTPWQGSLPPRAVKVMVEAKGFKPEERTISPRTDKVHEVYIALSEEHFLGWIEIFSNVAGAEVFIDRREGGAIGRTPFTGHVKPGKHTIWVQREGYQLATKEIDVKPGTANEHQVQLERVANGWVSVIGKQSKGGRLTIDGAFACETPCKKEAAPGKHTVLVEREGFEEYEAEVGVERSSDTSLNINFGPKPPRTRGWVMGAFSALFLGGGIYLGLESKKVSDAIGADVKNGVFVNSNDSRRDKSRYYAMGADAAFGLSALTGILSLVNFLASGPDSVADVDTKAIGLAPFGVAQGGGVAAQGRF